MTPLDALAARLAVSSPASLLYLSAHPQAGLTDVQARTDDGISSMQIVVRSDVTTVDDLAEEVHYDCALVADFLEHLPKTDGLAVLGRLRNLHAAQLLVFMDHDHSLEAWTFDDFLALGFSQDEKFVDENRTLTLYRYDIAAYNPERAWNNPRFWANPDMWGKYFW